MLNEKDDIIENEVVEENGLGGKLKKLREELKICQKEKAEYLAGWQRARADFINARKDEEKAKAEFAKFAGESILREMLAVADSLELAGKEMGPIYAHLRAILKREGVEQLEANGRKFDPMYHEALERVGVSEKEKNGAILEELQKGYKIYDRVLRPAKVKVGYYKIQINE